MQDRQYVSPRKAWWAVSILFFAYLFSYIDRSIISLLVQPLKKDLHISDTQIGILTGVAFSIFYATMALPIARLSDSRSRRAIIASGVAVWSLATMASGLAGRFWLLFLARMGVGVGEAVLAPAAMSLVADLFPKEKRGFALAVISASNQTGGGLALLVGGAAVAWVTSLGPLWGDFRPWQVVFIAVGLPGLIVAALTTTIVEPRDRQSERPPAGTVRELISFMRERWFVMTCHFTGYSLIGTAAYAVAVWGPTYFIRHFHLTISKVSLLMGLPLLVGGPVGGFIGGWLVNYFTRKGRDDAPMITGLIGVLLVWPAIMIAPHMPTVMGAAIVFGFSFMMGGIPAVGSFASVQLMTPAKFRAQVMALYFFVVTVVGIMGGATIVALFTDYLFHSDAAVGSSISLTAAILGPIMTLALFFSLKPFRQLARETDPII